MEERKIESALISVYYKDGLDKIVKALNDLDVKIYSTGGTYIFINNLGIEVEKVEDLTGFPSILGGRVKTLHPHIFGGILAKRNEDHLAQLSEYNIPKIDLVVVDLYPFEETLATTVDQSEIIEKIDIGGISLIRAGAKNFNDVCVISTRHQYSNFLQILESQNGHTSLEQRRLFASHAFSVSSKYDNAIHQYIVSNDKIHFFDKTTTPSRNLRYGENPHQKGIYYGDLDEIFEQLNGKELSYNNFLDIDSAIALMVEFDQKTPCFAVFKHTNVCGIAIAPTVLESWKRALAGDPLSAFGGILICNSVIDIDTAKEIDNIFYEVLLAPNFDTDALQYLKSKGKRIILKLKNLTQSPTKYRSILNGVLEQDADLVINPIEDCIISTLKQPEKNEVSDLIFAMKCVKHLKSNAIVLVKDNQLLGMGCGQTSRVESCESAIMKANKHNFSLDGAVMASDAFFPFPDCVELAAKAGITSVIQPGGSVKDQLSIDYCNQNGVSMVFTGIRHFRH